LWKNAAEAKSCFEQAIEIARKRSGKSLELRATISLARLLDKQGERDDPRTMPAEIFGSFTEGFDTAELKNAKALLATEQVVAPIQTRSSPRSGQIFLAARPTPDKAVRQMCCLFQL